MFEFMYAKKVKKEKIEELIDKYIDAYYLSVTYKPNGNVEIFVGGKKAESEE